MEKKIIKNLCVISAGVLESDGENYYGKSAVINYLHEISQYFNRTYFVAQIIGKPNLFNSKINQNKVIPLEIKYNRNLKHFVSKISRLLKDQINLFKILDRNTAVMIFYPNSWAILMLPIIWIKSGRYIAYLASDLDELIEMKRKEKGVKNTLKAFFYRMTQGVTFRSADVLLIRGRNTYEKIKKIRKKVFKSKPIISFTEKDIYQRNDTCQGKNIQLLYVGGLYRRKGVNVLLRAFSELVRENFIDKQIILKIVGMGEEYSKVKKLANELNIKNYVEFLGHIDNDFQLAQLYRKSDIFVLSSLLAEGFPRVLDEAMCFSLPIVVSDVAGIFKELKDQFCAIKVQPGDIKDLKKAIKRLILNNNLRHKLICNGRKRFIKVIDSGTVAKQHSDIVLCNLK